MVVVEEDEEEEDEESVHSKFATVFHGLHLLMDGD